MRRIPVSLAAAFLLLAVPAARAAEPVPAPALTFDVIAKPLRAAPPGFREETLVRSRDGLHIAGVVGESSPYPGDGPLLMVAMNHKKVHVVVDDHDEKDSNAVGVPVFSPDGAHWAYDFAPGLWGPGAERIVQDGAEVASCAMRGMIRIPCTAVGAPVFSADGTHLAFRARQHKVGTFGPAWRMIVDGETLGESYSGMTDPVFANDGTPVFLAARGKRNFLVRGLHAAPAVDANEVGWVTLSSDGRRIAYLAYGSLASVSVVVDGVPGAPHEWVGGVALAIDGRFAYAARDAGRAFIVVEGAPAPMTFRDVGDPVFSPDGRHLAYWAWDGSASRVVMDGVAGPPFDQIAQVLFSPDGRHLAAEARRGGEWHLLVDGVEGPAYPRTRRLDGYETQVPTVTGTRRGLYRNDWVFAGNDRLTYVGVRDGALTRWEVRLVEPANN